MPRPRYQLAAFPSQLGWGAILATKDEIVQLVLGQASGAAALAAIDASLVEEATPRHTWKELIRRLQGFARGRIVDFFDVPLAMTEFTPFQQMVIRECRQIPYGATLSYGELARRAGSPRAARAVGSTMARCRHSILVPCHRVITASGAPGGFGGAAGTAFKRRLLELEKRTLAAKQSKRSPRTTLGGM